MFFKATNQSRKKLRHGREGQLLQLNIKVKLSRAHAFSSFCCCARFSVLFVGRFGLASQDNPVPAVAQESWPCLSSPHFAGSPSATTSERPFPSCQSGLSPSTPPNICWHGGSIYSMYLFSLWSSCADCNGKRKNAEASNAALRQDVHFLLGWLNPGRCREHLLNQTNASCCSRRSFLTDHAVLAAAEQGGYYSGCAYIPLLQKGAALETFRRRTPYRYF